MSKRSFFGALAFFQPTRAFESILNRSDWLEKSRPSKEVTYFFGYMKAIYQPGVSWYIL